MTKIWDTFKFYYFKKNFRAGYSACGSQKMKCRNQRLLPPCGLRLNSSLGSKHIDLLSHLAGAWHIF